MVSRRGLAGVRPGVARDVDALAAGQQGEDRRERNSEFRGKSRRGHLDTSAVEEGGGTVERAQDLGLNRVAALIGVHRPGHALVRDFYLDPAVHALDMDLLLDRWSFAGHISEVAVAGDFITAELGDDSAIVARGEDGVLHAMANVCRHRGSRVCVVERGSASAFVCPYHAWTYRLDGSLRGAREMAADFEVAAHGLKPLPLRVIGGLIFIAFGPTPPALDGVARAVEAMTTRYGWTEARIAARRRYTVAANWKLVMENYHECYHCQPAHPEFSVLHALARPGARSLDGSDDFEAWDAAPDGREVGRVMASPLARGQLSGTRDGALAAPPMTDEPAAVGACVFSEVGFLSALLAYQDHGVIYRFIPRGVMETEMEVLWLVKGDAREGADYDVERLTWLWDVTSLADKRIIETNQAGVRSRLYEPGPFSPMEPGTQGYVERYLGELAQRLERATDGL
jgi:phenylpropionate dioxygenase-like ring-hydroxylating dioxygenase large terminal subunit